MTPADWAYFWDHTFAGVRLFAWLMALYVLVIWSIDVAQKRGAAFQFGWPRFFVSAGIVLGFSIPIIDGQTNFFRGSELVLMPQSAIDWMRAYQPMLSVIGILSITAGLTISVGTRLQKTKVLVSVAFCILLLCLFAAYWGIALE